jgi:hypothetical protein
MKTMTATTAIGIHGTHLLSTVQVDTYNAELRDAEGFIGDRASNRAFRGILEDWREQIREIGKDPIGDVASADISKKALDKLITAGEPEAAGLLIGTVEEFAQEFATVIRRFLRLKEWRDTQRIVVGGGLRASRVGELAIGRYVCFAEISRERCRINADPTPPGRGWFAWLSPPRAVLDLLRA